MYCKYCGSKMDDDAIFCSQCGKKLSPADDTYRKNRSTYEQEDSWEEIDKEKERGCLTFVCLTCVIIVGVLLVTLFGTYAGNHEGIKALTREDYTYTTDQGLSSYSVTITPKTNIKVCDVELKLYDKEGSVVFSDTITKNELKEGKTYTYVFEFGVLNALSGKSVKINVSGERQSIFR